jgi:DNA invertase Pin-like site-specific DNA recombinase
MAKSPIGLMRHGSRQLTFEDLKGLRAEGYIRDSTPDQRDGFGPDIQQRNIERFAEVYDLVLGNRWYTEFVSGRKVSKRREFREFLEDATVDRFDVLLVDHTSRFGRNQEECIRYKGELKRLGKLVVFVSQGIISGRDQDFINERINETVDEAYSLNLSRWVDTGLWLKHEEGVANGVPPLGYKSLKLDNGKRERKVINPETMPALLELLRCYASGQYSYQNLADHLNVQGFRNRIGEPFTSGSIEHVLSNRFYEGKVVYHPGKFDEEVRDGVQEVPPEVNELWLRCQKSSKSEPRQLWAILAGQLEPIPSRRCLPAHNAAAPTTVRQSSSRQERFCGSFTSAGAKDAHAKCAPYLKRYTPSPCSSASECYRTFAWTETGRAVSSLPCGESRILVLMTPK